MDAPADAFDDPLRSALCEMLSMRLGLHFPPERWPDLLRRLAPAVAELGYRTLQDSLHGLLAKPLGQRELEVLGRHLTVGETYFFRDPEIFAALEQQLLPDLIRHRRDTTRRIRIWSIGCSSGEEAYSIAITVANMLPDLDRWDVSIQATDINLHALTLAREGVYGNWSFRTPLPPAWQRWFYAPRAGHRAVAPQIKSLVSFSYLNLMDGHYPAVETNTNAMDLIFCRNVLMYFHPQRVAEALERIGNSLLGGGWLVLSPVESALVTAPPLRPRHLPGVLFYQKAEADGTWPLAAEPMTHPPHTASSAPAPHHGRTSPPISEPSPPAPSLPPPAPAPAQTLVRQAREQADRGQLAEALASCDQAIAQDKLNPAWAFLRASILLELGYDDDAAAALQRTLYLDHDFVMAHVTLANLLQRRGRHASACKHYRNALELLAPLDAQQVPLEADGMTAGRLREYIAATLAADGEAAPGQMER
ncbi:MAG: chemotaxis protein CheR [Proteobacteria bacterium]|nr:chemotaxis protein CheR [Pseudomonadota bacterium]